MKQWPPLLAAFLIPAAVYAASASPEPGSWDTAELQGVPYILGIAHPTGFPLYVLVGYLWSHAAILGSIALRMNVLSGVAVAIVCVSGYVVARQLGAPRSAALAATLWFAFTQNVWAHASRAEAQDVAIALAAVSLYCFIRWIGGGDHRWLLAAFLSCGLALAAHPNALWLLPAFGVGIAVARSRPPLRVAAGALALLLAPLLLYLYLPLRSQYVVLHRLDPTAGLPGVGGGIFWNYNDPHTARGLAAELTGSQFETPQYVWKALDPRHAGDVVRTLGDALRQQYGVVAALAIALGLLMSLRRNWRVTVVLCIACTAGLFFSVAYPNEGDVGRYRLLVSWLAVPLLSGLVAAGAQPRRSAAVGLLSFALLSGALTAFVRNDSLLRHTPHEGGRWVIDAVAPQVPAGSVIVTGWLDATSLAYGAYVDRSLAGRIIVSDDQLRMWRYRQWAAREPVYVLVNPHDVPMLEGAIDDARLDEYHELYRVTPPGGV